MQGNYFRDEGGKDFGVLQLKVALTFWSLMSLCLSLSCVDLLTWVNCCVIQEWKGCKLSLGLKLSHGEILLFLSLNNN